jgi:hypothetical protein
MSNKSKWDHGSDTSGRFRGGKTAEEKKNGTHAARFANRAAREAWQKDRNATNATFPG